MGKVADIIILIIIGSVGFKCYFMGFTRSIWGWGALASGIFVASRAWTYLAGFLDNLIKNEQIVKIASIIIIVFVVTVIMDRLFRILSAIVLKGVIKWLDSALGIAFGVALAGLLIGGVLILLEQYANDSYQKIILQSKFSPFLIKFTRYVIDVGKSVIDKSEGVPI